MTLHSHHTWPFDPLDIDHRAADLPFDDPAAALTDDERALRRELRTIAQEAWIKAEREKQPKPSEDELMALFDAMPARFSPWSVVEMARDTYFALDCMRAWFERGWMAEVDKGFVKQ